MAKRSYQYSTCLVADRRGIRCAWSELEDPIDRLQVSPFSDFFTLLYKPPKKLPGGGALTNSGQRINQGKPTVRAGRRGDGRPVPWHDGQPIRGAAADSER